MSEDTHELYNQSAAKWARREPNSLSDFTARPRVFELCGDVKNKNILDLGAGEGYCAREMALRGAKSILGIELSEKMVELAKKQLPAQADVIEYRVGDVTNLGNLDMEFDLALGVFVYNYLTTDQMLKSFEQVYKLLGVGAEFVFSVPHPSFPFIKKELTKPFYFDCGDAGYFSGRNKLCNGEIYCRDGQSLPVQMIPKSLEDYFAALSQAGFTTMPELIELTVTPEMVLLDEDFFSPLIDIPLHLAVKVRK